MKEFVSDVRIGIASVGVSSFLSHAGGQLIGPYFSRAHLMVIEQDLDATREVKPPAGVTVGVFDGDWDAAEGLLTARSRERFKRRAGAGRHCLVASRDGRIVGYTWISTEIVPEIEALPLALPETAAYLWDLFVPIGERSTGIGSALTSARMRHAAALGFRLGWRAISPKNRPSIRTAEKTGAVRVLGEIRISRRFGTTRYVEDRFEGRALLDLPVDR
ncbi:MAG: N-acetyltransferase family protein [Gemmatimonadota bacterium]